MIYKRTGECEECGRDYVTNGEGNLVHTDGRVKHEVVPVPEETVPMEEYSSVVDPNNPEDASLMETAKGIFEDMEPEVDLGTDPPVETPIDEAIASAELSENEVVETVKPSKRETKPMFGAPKKDKMITVRGGGKYLKARDRIVWMRGEPEQHPDWTIDTVPEEVVRGTLKNKNEVTGGYARIRANVYDETGRLIASGTKTEFSERFMDFVEKAETGAIARALAVAGYGTEAALDLDEGLEADRIADAPVASRPITISSSNIEGLVQGGRSKHATTAQLNEVERLAVRTEIGSNIVTLIENVCSVKVPDLSDNPGEVLREFLLTLTFDQMGDLIQALNKLDAEGQE
jgi:hypothetical protein